VNAGRFIIVAVVLVLIGGVVLLWWNSRLEQSQDRFIRAAAARYQLDPALVKAVVWRESRFNPYARGRAQEIGLMQLREEAAQEWADAEHLANFAHEHCLDPGTNMMAGTFYLQKLLKRYRNTDDPVPFALADYNAGRANVLKWLTGAAATNSAAFIDQIGFPSTREYVRTIMRRAKRYRWMMRQPAGKSQAATNAVMALRSLRSTNLWRSAVNFRPSFSCT
jgi:soluble lytic murein transglycosylase